MKLDASLDWDEQEHRLIYASNRLVARIQNELPQMDSVWKIELSPIEQLDGIVHAFCAGLPLTYGHHFKPLNPIRNGVWELKTADLRVFGWFEKKDCFVAWTLDLTDTIKRGNLYQGYVNETVFYRDRLALDEPKFIPGNNPHDVVSDFSFP